MIAPQRSANFLAPLVAIAIGASSLNTVAAELAASQWVHPNPDGKLIYKTTPAGDRIMDFSHAGYMGGGVALPTVPVKGTVKPSGNEDDTAAIQAAIDEVAALPPVDGFRGAVLLAPGVYPCSKPISISASGVVLRGSGATGDAKSTLKMTSTPHLAITIRSPTGRAARGSQPDAQNNQSAASKPAETSIADV